MKKKILATLVAGTVLATSAYAFHQKGEWGPQCRKYAQDYAKKNGECPSFNDKFFFHGKKGFHEGGFRGRGFG